MKKLITVRANEESYDILLNEERLDALEDEKLCCLIRGIEAYITAYQSLRRARAGIERAEMEMKDVKTEPQNYTQGRFADDIPF